MDKYITFGFVPVTQSYKKGNQMKNGTLLFESNHVHDVYEKHIYGEKQSTIEGRVIPQTHVNNNPSYSTTIVVDENRRVVATQCSCRAGSMNGGCKHALALILYINSDKSSKSKTDLERQWGKPSQKNVYKKGAKVKDMFGTSKSRSSLQNIAPYNLTAADLIGISCPLAMTLNAELKSDLEVGVEETLNFLIDSVVGGNELDALDSILTNLLFSQSQRQQYHSEDVSITLEIADYFNDNICLSGKEIIEVAKLTTKQFQSPLWSEIRKCRISATKAHSIIVRKSNFDKLADAFITNKKFQVAATTYGIQKEEVAFAEFKTYVNEGFKLVKLGVILKPAQPWLCCSPDGILVNESANIAYPLEIKCPFSCRKKPICDNNGLNVKYLYVDENRNLQL